MSNTLIRFSYLLHFSKGRGAADLPLNFIRDKYAGWTGGPYKLNPSIY